MTALNKLVKRECQRTSDRGRPVIVSLEPGDLLGFRLKGCRMTYRLTLGKCFLLAAQAHAQEQKRLRKLAREQRRKEREL